MQIVECVTDMDLEPHLIVRVIQSLREFNDQPLYKTEQLLCSDHINAAHYYFSEEKLESRCRDLEPIPQAP